jgi:phosphopantothenate synthetase
MSRTSRAATVTIVDEVTRAIPELIRNVEDLAGDPKVLRRITGTYDREENLDLVAKMMSANLADFLKK